MSSVPLDFKFKSVIILENFFCNGVSNVYPLVINCPSIENDFLEILLNVHSSSFPRVKFNYLYWFVHTYKYGVLLQPEHQGHEKQ